MISYAQNFEDVILERIFKSVASGFYVDVGAWEPTMHSVTRWFYDRGWSGINIEPSPVFARLAAERPRDVNIQVALADRPGITTLHFHKDNEQSGIASILGLSSIEKSVADSISLPPNYDVTAQDMEVRVQTLSEILDEHAGDRHIHFMKIDVEGAEEKVLQGANFQTHRPEVIVIEATKPLTDIRNDAEWTPILSAAGYQMAYFDGLNCWFVRDESAHLREFFSLPPNVHDGFAPDSTEHNIEVSKLTEIIENNKKLIEDNEVHLANFRAETSMQSISMKRMENVILEAQADAARSRQEIDRIRQELDCSHQEIDRLRLEAERSQGEIDSSREELDLANREIDRSHQEVASLLQDKWTLLPEAMALWALPAPIRQLGRNLSRRRNKPQIDPKARSE